MTPPAATLEDDDEVDFDDPRFLVDVTPREDELTYAERRRKTVGRGRHNNHNNKSIKQREQEERERGLSTSLFDRQPPPAIANAGAPPQDSAALRMMKQMGFKPGEALGRKRQALPDDSTAQSDSARSTDSDSVQPHNTASLSTGISSASRSSTEPLKFEIRERRTGLGVPQPKKARVLSHLQPSGPDDAANPLPPEQLQAYLDSVRSNVDERKAFGYLRSLRRTCEELDRRNGIQDSPMWKDPDELEREQVAVIRRRAFLRDNEDENVAVGALTSSSSTNARQREGSAGLAYDKGLSHTVVDSREDDEQAGTNDAVDETAKSHAEEQEWFAMDVRTRLGLTLAYLRREYHYCFWCGVAYENAQDMTDHCPGEAEGDH
ncbi:hypothetical protein OIV83_004866 [Microbotryomycetes sp. JL201]|nr:hypothetical protein OIV83_004866 [Microbotryomycetes sp. JL201]